MDRYNDKIANLLLNNICQDYFTRAAQNEVYLNVSEDEFQYLMRLLPEVDTVLISLFCVENFENAAGFTLFYVIEKRGAQNFVILKRKLEGNVASSASEYFPSAGWFEREIRDGFGIDFYDAVDKRRLFLHEAYPSGFHPLLKSFKNQDITASRQAMNAVSTYLFKEVKGGGVYQIPVGPVHAGIIEPGHFRFSVIGETIFNLEVRMFYKHRGLEKLTEGKTPVEAVTIAETISGDESAANSAAFCMAVEKIAHCSIPERAWFLRTILLEMERIYSHLGDLAGMNVDVAFPVGASDFNILREEILRFNATLTGSRFLKGIICPGGLRKDIASKTLFSLNTYLNYFRNRLKRASDFILRNNSVIDRLETTGVINKALVNPLNITGPAARATGVEIDNRIDHPYGIYHFFEMDKRTALKGDVLARFEVKTAEILDSIEIIQKCVSAVKIGSVSMECMFKDGFSLTVVESARGQNVHWVYIRNGLIDRYKIRTASFCNWQSIEHAVIGNIVPDFPLINKSLNLSYAGTDL
jgi:formate hydrogenlyase subunit 5